MAHRSLDRLDKKILHLISEDARIPFLEVHVRVMSAVQPFISVFRS